MKRILTSIGPAIIIAAVVLGPGSIMTSTRVGAQLGLVGIPIIAVATALMMAMVLMATRLGAACEHSLCTELSHRLSRPVAVSIGVILFLLVAIFQSSNNIAVISGMEPLAGTEVLTTSVRIGLLGLLNLVIVGVLYLLPNVYSSIERLMKLLIGIMVLAFVTNLAVVMSQPRAYEPIADAGAIDWLAMLGMIGTTFSVPGAFYQAYLIREKGWSVDEVRRGTLDSVLSISILGGITCVILLTAWRVFHGHPQMPEMKSVGQLAIVLEPTIGRGAQFVFAGGILAGAFSSFLANALIGGTVLSDAVGLGSQLEDRWPLHLTTLALFAGFGIAAVSLSREGSTVHLITFAQALTVVGGPAIAAAIVYLGTRPDLYQRGHISGRLISVTTLGFVVACVLAALTVNKILPKIGRLLSAELTVSDSLNVVQPMSD